MCTDTCPGSTPLTSDTNPARSYKIPPGRNSLFLVMIFLYFSEVVGVERKSRRTREKIRLRFDNWRKMEKRHVACKNRSRGNRRGKRSENNEESDLIRNQEARHMSTKHSRRCEITWQRSRSR